MRDLIREVMVMAASRLEAILAAQEILAPSQIMPGMLARVLSIVASQGITAWALDE